MFKNIYQLICFVFLISNSFTVFSSDEEGRGLRCQNSSMPFKIGFEFQESKKLCSWAKNDEFIRFLKKPLFYINDTKTGRKLCTVVIDDGEIEFITDPFKCNEKEYMEKSINIIQQMCGFLSPIFYSNELLLQVLQSDTLKRISSNSANLNKIKNGLKKSEITHNISRYNLWKEWLLAKDEQEEEIKKWWNKNNDQVGFSLEQIIKFSGINIENKTNFNEWVANISRLEGIEVIKDEKYFNIVSDKNITKVDNLTFKPQVTIQYPLEYTIPLFFKLYNFSHQSEIVSKFGKCLPYLNEKIWEDYKEDNSVQVAQGYFTKINGLTFLLALTLDAITTKGNIEDCIRNLHQRYEDKGQFDAKGTLYFMSRRPFSEMWNEIKAESQNFSDSFKQSMGNNALFKRNFCIVNDDFEWLPEILPNYGEQFLVDDQVRGLSCLWDDGFFIDNFTQAIQQNENLRSHVKNFLEKSILTTAMIRYLDPNKVKILNMDDQVTDVTFENIFETYYEACIQSVQLPYLTYSFVVEKNQFIEEEALFDRLSPPLFLRSDDSMGAYKKLKRQDTETFGEAIIELRHIDRSFIDTLGQGRESLFLSSLMHILKDADIIFDFLVNMNWENALQEDYKKFIIYCNSKRSV